MIFTNCLNDDPCRTDEAGLAQCTRTEVLCSNSQWNGILVEGLACFRIACSCFLLYQRQNRSADVSFPDIELKRVAFGSCNKQLGREVKQE
jgi:hypothetical protein